MNELERWYKEFKTHRQFPMSIEDNQKYVTKIAFLAGAAAMREKAAEVAEGTNKHLQSAISPYNHGMIDQAHAVAAAIRKLGVE